MNDLIEQFGQGIAGHDELDHIIAAGAIHRYSTNGTPNFKCGRLVLRRDVVRSTTLSKNKVGKGHG